MIFLRIRMRVHLHDAHRQAVRVGVVLAVVGHPLLDELGRPRLIAALASGVLPPTLPNMFRANGLPRPRPPPGAPAAGRQRPAGGGRWRRGGASTSRGLPEPGVGLRPSMTGGAQSGHGAVSQTPERSGLPSAVRGAGAFEIDLAVGRSRNAWRQKRRRLGVQRSLSTADAVKARVRSVLFHGVHCYCTPATL